MKIVVIYVFALQLQVVCSSDGTQSVHASTESLPGHSPRFQNVGRKICRISRTYNNWCKGQSMSGICVSFIINNARHLNYLKAFLIVLVWVLNCLSVFTAVMPHGCSVSDTLDVPCMPGAASNKHRPSLFPD